MKTAFLSLFDTEKPGSEVFARELIDLGYDIVSSGGTAKYLQGHGIPVTDISEITGYPPVLKHRVVTLAPQVHGGLLATEEMLPELDELGWKKIDLLYVTLYPLQAELEKEDATFESCLEKTDIGGPTMIRSANKGGEVVVLSAKKDEELVLEWLKAGCPDRKSFLFKLRAQAERRVAMYCALSAEVYSCFALEAAAKGQV